MSLMTESAVHAACGNQHLLLLYAQRADAHDQHGLALVGAVVWVLRLDHCNSERCQCCSFCLHLVLLVFVSTALPLQGYGYMPPGSGITLDLPWSHCNNRCISCLQKVEGWSTP